MKLDKNPDPKLLSYAKHFADVFESEIAFIDIYETKDGYVLSEINTACDLTLHEKKSGHDIARDIAVYLVSQVDKQRV
jgi:glutathione synthase/RimK-type ligase-like ATP-grasp enzyme